MAEPFFGLLEETFHPLPTLIPGAVAIGLNIESYKQRARPAFSNAAMLPGILIDLASCRGKSLKGRCQGDPTVAQASYPLETVFVSVRSDPDGYPRLLHGVR